MDCSMPVSPVLHYLQEFAQTNVHGVKWCHPTISSSVVPFSSCPQSFLASGSVPKSQLFASDGQNTEASAIVLPMNIQGWYPLGLTSLISVQPKRLSRVFSNTIHDSFKIIGVLSCRLFVSLYLSEWVTVCMWMCTHKFVVRHAFSL